MSDLWSDLLACLDLRPLPHAAAPAFEGTNQQLAYHRLFGGQLLAQFVRAAQRLGPDKAVKSLHVLFPRAGRSGEPVHYEAARVQEGNTFATWSLTARQSAGVIATAAVSLHRAEPGVEHQFTAPVPVVLGPEHRVEFELLPWETRASADLDSPGVAPAELDLWMRTPHVEADLGPALLAYVTDLTLIGTALRAVDGIGQQDSRQGVHLGRHLAHRVVPPLRPRRRLAAASPARAAPRPRPLPRARRRLHRGRLPRGVLRTGRTVAPSALTLTGGPRRSRRDLGGARSTPAQ